MQQQFKEIFSRQGLLSQHVVDYAPRKQQLEMAETVWQALTEKTVLITEAGTGTGKTYAYLAPAILSGCKVFISTGTRNLQDQLFNKDLPVLKKALGVAFRASLLKGRSNYLCLYRLNMARGDTAQKSHQAKLQVLTEWAEKTKSGDLSTSNVLADDSGLWPKVTSTVDNCLNQKCPDYHDCFITEARKKAQEADIVVINHHLLMSDMMVKATSQGEVLPSADAYIIDEAHQLPNVAAQFLGVRVSSYQLRELCADSTREMQQGAEDMAAIGESADKLKIVLHRFIISLGDKVQRAPWYYLHERSVVNEKFADLIASLKGLAGQLELAAERSSGLEQCYNRCDTLINTLTLFATKKQTHDELVLWADIRANGVILHATPLDISQHMQNWMDDGQRSWVFTSATLTVADQFDSFIDQLGIDDTDTKIWPSPFDFAAQSLVYLPAIPIEPNHDDYSDHIADVARQIISYSKGRTFILFTSYRAMYHVADILKQQTDYPLLVQGSAAKSTLVDKFRDYGNAVLLGTNSFWEGVDVRGDALVCVIIDRIPFESPTDPVLQARIAMLKKAGGNPFVSMQIPTAVIRLKQGIGRLIRDPNDYGVLVLCDPRLSTKRYGKVFLDSLPPTMPVTQQSEDVAAFFAATGH